MNLHRIGATFIAAAVAAVSVGGCGGEETITPTGPHYHYVVNRLLAPTDDALSKQYGVDLNGDGSVDNQLGIALNLISSLGAGSFDVQASIDKAILGGEIITLIDLQTPDFNSAAGAGVEFFLGENPQPAACNGPTDTVVCNDLKPSTCTGCGNHLTNGSFSINASSQNSAVPGKITGGTFSGGPGEFTLLVSLIAGAKPIRFDVFGAKIKATGMSEATIGTSSGASTTGGFILAGAVTQDDVNNTILPGVVGQLNAAIMKDCNMLTGPPDCGCENPSTGKSILGEKTINPIEDCKIEENEVKTVAGLVFKQDVQIDGMSATSVGVKVTATKATFTVPGQ